MVFATIFLKLKILSEDVYMKDEILIDILKNQVTPALGCTEPGAVAYAVARVKEILGYDVEELNLEIDKNILKNGMSVGIPGTNEHGIIFAAALSLAIGKSEYGLEVLKDVDSESIDKALEIVKSDIIKIVLNENVEGLYIKVVANAKKEEACVIIKNSHTNIVYESKNNEVLLDTMQTRGQSIESKITNTEIKYKIKDYSVKKMIEFIDSIPIEKLNFILNGIEMNLRIAEKGLNNNVNGIGDFLLKNSDDVFSRAKAYTAAASEARMSGYPLPVMSSAGSGNHGLVAIIPISYIGYNNKLSEEKIIRSVTLSHLINIFVKIHIGALSPVCGCGVAAGVGCAAGLTYLLGGTISQIEASINNMIAGISGMLCDGAKIGCSYKLSISVDAAVDASLMALQNIFIPNNNGILGETPEKTIENFAVVSNVGMKDTDASILSVMLNKC